MLETVLENRHSNMYRNKRIPRPELAYDKYLKPRIQKKEKKERTVEERIIKKILETPEEDGDEDKPLTLYTESLKGYFKDLKNL